MSFYKISDIRYSDVAGNTLSLGNIPVRVNANPLGDRIELVDPNNATPRIDPDSCDTPNFSMRTCCPAALEYLRARNNTHRRQADQFLELKLGRRRASALISPEDTTARSIAAFFGLFNQCEIDAAALPPRIRDRNANSFLPTSGDPTFRRASGKYRRLRRLDTHPALGSDASWFTPHHFVIRTPRKDTNS